MATGSIKAQLAPKAAGMASNMGFCPSPIAIEARIGKKAAVVAVLLVISVRNIMSSKTKPINKNIGHVFKAPTPCPIQLARPVSLIAAARLSPPPNNIKTPQGNLSVSDQVNMNSPFLKSTGIINRDTAAAMAIPASDSPGI